MRHAILAAASLTALAACNTVPDEPVAPPVEIVAAPIDTCTPMSALTRQVVPAVTKVFYATTEIANPPYEPIERTERQERIIEPERIIFVNSEGTEVTDICDPDINPGGMVNGQG